MIIPMWIHVLFGKVMQTLNKVFDSTIMKLALIRDEAYTILKQLLLMWSQVFPNNLV